MKLHRMAVGLLLLAASVDSHAQAERLFLDKKHWMNFDWEKVEQSAIFQDEGFQPPTPGVTNDDPKHVFEKYKKVDLWGHGFMASVAKHPLRLKNDREFNLSLLGMLDENKNIDDPCTYTRLKLEQIFGKPVGPYDYSIELVPGAGMREINWEWSLGKSLLRLQCGHLGDLDDVFLRFTANDDDFKTFEPLYLSCERNIKYAESAGPSEKLSSMQLIILLSSQRVLNTDRYVIGGVTDHSESFIKIKMDRKDIVMEYTLNRIDGSLIGAATKPDNQKLYGNFSGSCVKSDPNARKF
jgi:hypothetical protein